MLTTETKIEIYEKWNQIVPDLLSGLTKENALELATLMENQRLINELTRTPHAQFQRISVPLVRRVFGPDFWLRNIVDFSAMSGPAVGAVIAKTRWLKARFTPVTHESCSKLDDECEYAEKLSSQIREEITKEILNDLLNNVGTKTNDIPSCLEGVYQKSGVPAGWVVCHSNYDDPGEFLSRAVNLKTNRTDFIDEKTLLFGSNTCGYCYHPYVPFTLAGQKPDEINETYGMLMRYGKKLFSSSGYGKVTLS